MPASLFQYEMLATTWVFVSALMTIAIFFKFNRIWSVRNLDLVAVILSGVGLIYLAMNEIWLGSIWMMSLCVLLMVRMLFDTIMVRRPLLEPNLTLGGMVFASVALLAFLVAAASVNRGAKVDSLRAVRLDQILTARAEAARRETTVEPTPFPARPGLPLFHEFCRRVEVLLLPSPEMQSEIVRIPRDASQQVLESLPLVVEPPLTTNAETDIITPVADAEPSTTQETTQSPISAPTPILPKSEATEPILVVGLVVIAISHAMIALGLVLVGGRHFGSVTTGIAAATLYLLLPYTHQMVGRIDHFLPAAILVWMVFFYRRPLVSGFLLGIASGLIFYPIFLVPLWCAFYARRGWSRFVIGLAVAATAFLVVPYFSSPTSAMWINSLGALAGIPAFAGTTLDGIWLYVNPVYRIPIIAAFGAMCIGMAIWPSHKHLGTLLCCSTLVLLGVECWQPIEGGIAMGWFLPTLVLTFFRPNLEDRTVAAVY
ncbi:MAG: hypothetical protein ACRC46_15025 [Thermoguttaceae bacterium]